MGVARYKWIAHVAIGARFPWRRALHFVRPTDYNADVDTTQPIIYRGYTLNDPDLKFDTDLGGLGTGAQGSVVDSFDISDVDIVQFVEKRALEDGMDASDVFQGARRVKMTGTLYGKTRGLFYDEVDKFMAATSAVLAQRDEPANKGYVPLYWAKPTNRAEYEDDSYVIEQFVYALPRTRHTMIERDAQGGPQNKGLGATWSATFLLKDPAIYGVTPIDVDLSSGNVSDTWTNRGNYISRLNFLCEVGSGAGTIVISAGDATLTITVPSSSGDRIIRYNGKEKFLTFEENSVESLRMDLLGLNSEGAHPTIPPGDSVYTVTFTSVTPQSGSHMWFYEVYA